MINIEKPESSMILVMMNKKKLIPSIEASNFSIFALHRAKDNKKLRGRMKIEPNCFPD